MDLASKIASDIVIFSKYAKHKPELKRRESWGEIVDRYEKMMIKKYPTLAEEITYATGYIRGKKVLPSMRMLQFAGAAIEKNHARGYNCSFINTTDTSFFKELMFLLLGGTGVGYSVQSRHIGKLPSISVPTRTRKWMVGDSIEGWADSINGLIRAFFSGKPLPRFDYSDVREKGTLLVTAGGKAPGPGPLRICHDKILGLLETKKDGDRLSSVEVSDIACFIADAVLAGGIRRAAMIALFDKDDEHMLHYKSGAWWELRPERARVNVSAICLRETTTKEEFEKIFKITEASGAGEPGIIWSNDAEEGTNPCLPPWALVLTKKGIRELSEVSQGDQIWSSQGWTTITKKWSTGIKEVYRYKTSAGIFYGTKNHRILQRGLKVRVDEATGIDIIKGSEAKLPINHQDIMDGLVLGDGSVHGASNNLVYLCIGKSDGDYFDSEISKFIKKKRTGLGSYAYEINTTVESHELPKTYQRQIPTRFLFDNTKYRGLLRGIFSANGSVCGNRVTLKGTSLKFIEQVQVMLNAMGIRSYITKNKAKEVQFKNGPYLCKESYDLNISKDKGRFVTEVGFLQAYKNAKIKPTHASLDAIKASDIQEVEYISTEEVFDITVDNDSHTFWTQGCDVSNCAEIALRSHEFCNLTTINLSDITTQVELNERVGIAALLGTLQAGFVDFHYLGHTWEDNCKEESLLGISMTGVADNPEFINLDLEEASDEAMETNKYIAEKIGINKAARVTCLKPEGSSSLVLGTASGIHGRHAPFYIRRFRFKRNEPIIVYFASKFPTLVVEDKFDPDTLILELPQKSPSGSIMREEPAHKTLERAQYFHKHWVAPGHRSGPNGHNVSVTVSVKEDEWDSVGKWMWENRNNYNGISLLPYDGGSYVQAPFEDCTEETYNKMMEQLKEVDLSEVIEDDDTTTRVTEVACSGGKCDL